MILPNGAVVVVADGEKLNIFHNSGSETEMSLKPMQFGAIETGSHGSGAGHHASAANPDHGQVEEDGHSAGVAALLNAEVTAGRIQHLVVVASPRALGELRKNYSKQLIAVLLGEIDKDLTGHALKDVEKAVANA